MCWVYIPMFRLLSRCQHDNGIRYTILAFVFCVLYITNTFAEPQVPTQKPNQSYYLKLIPPDKLKEDLDFLFKTIEEVHPNMYAYTSKEEFVPLRKQLYKSINQPINRLEFYKLVAPVVASFKSGHTYMPPPPSEFGEYILKG